MNTDVVVAVSDRATDSLNVLFNTDVGRATSRAAACRPNEIAALASFGLSGICNVLAADQDWPSTFGSAPTMSSSRSPPTARRSTKASSRRRSRSTSRAVSTSGRGPRCSASTSSAPPTDHLLELRRQRPAADLQPRILHLGRAAGRVARGLRSAAGADVLAFPARARPRLGRPHRGAERAGRRPARLEARRRAELPADDEELLRGPVHVPDGLRPGAEGDHVPLFQIDRLAALDVD